MTNYMEIKQKNSGKASKLIIKKNFLTNNRCYQAGVTCQKTGIQLHTIGTGQGTAQSVADYWNQISVSACTHYCVDAEVPGKVLYLLPEDRRSWADAGYGNNHLITFEICESDWVKYTQGANYLILDQKRFEEDIRRGYETAVQLCADICFRHQWWPKARLESGLYLISSHNEGRLAGLSSSHVDPDHVWGKFGLSMDGFREDVQTLLRKRLPYQVGMKLKLLKGIPLRTNPSTEWKKGDYVMYPDLSKAAQKRCRKLLNGRARVKKGVTVTVQDTCFGPGGDIWVRIPSGWLPVVVGGVERVKIKIKNSENILKK